MHRSLPALAVSGLLSISLTAAAAPFRDIPPGHWATLAVDEAVTQGLMNGFPGEAFRGELFAKA
mgnify:CR=1 FL=1